MLGAGDPRSFLVVKWAVRAVENTFSRDLVKFVYVSLYRPGVRDEERAQYRPGVGTRVFTPRTVSTLPESAPCCARPRPRDLYLTSRFSEKP